MNNGKRIENIIEKELNKIKNGYFIKSPTPIRITKDKKIIYAKKALCDFIGIYNQKFILIEIKTITKNFEFRRLKKHQLEQLEIIDKLGGISLIIFYLINEEKICYTNINDFREIIKNSKMKSISKENIILKTINIEINNITNIFN
ncbi:MAG: hypothetical protein HPAVJP_1850 [Candidatus Hepatoplasma vulgare]|nr:MAG: hypothetical protein HPAVJP_1850 [Candidatus Hepatoplasma sp.]